MRKFVILGILIAFHFSLYGQKTRLGQTQPVLSTVHIHISASHLRPNCNGNGTGVDCSYSLYAQAVLNGKKIELWGDSKIGKLSWALLAPGDYTAQLTTDEHNADQSVVSQRFRILLPDNTTWQCQLSGILE